MATNYASKYSDLVDERFFQKSLTHAAVNHEYDFTGVDTVNVYSIPTKPMRDYSMTGLNRYGVPEELGSNVQSMTLTKDRAFTFTIDRRNYEDTMMVKEAGRALRRQLDEESIPEIDKYRLSVITAGAGTITEPTAITNGTGAYEAFLTGVTTLLDNKAPLEGTFAFIGSNFYKQIRLDPAFIVASDLGQQSRFTGQVGQVEGIPLVFVPNSYLVPGTEFIITNRIAVTGPTKISDYKVHDNPVGINGWIIEGRFYYDAFILNNKRPVIYVHRGAAA